MLPNLPTIEAEYEYMNALFSLGAYDQPDYAPVLKNRETTGPFLWAMIQKWPETFAYQVLKIRVAKYCREFEQGVAWSEALLATIDESDENWIVLQQLRIYCYEFDYELETALMITTSLLAKGYDQKLWKNYATLLYKLHRTDEAVAFLKIYVKTATSEQAVAIEKEKKKYQRYVQEHKKYEPMYKKGDKTLLNTSFKQEIAIAEPIAHQSDFSIRVLLSSSSGNVSLLHVDGSYYLIDCGVSKTRIAQMLAENGVRLDELAGIFITHSHSDHVKGLAMMTKYHDVPVYLGQETAFEVTEQTNFKKDGRSTQLHTWNDTEFMLDNLQVTILPTSHDTEYSCGFKFTYADKTLVYLTDLGTADADLLAQAKGANCYVFEANHEVEMLAATNRPLYLKKRIASDSGHLNNTQSAQYLQQLITAETGTIILAHLSQEANTSEQAKKIFEQYNAEFTGKLHIAQAETATTWEEIGN